MPLALKKKISLNSQLLLAIKDKDVQKATRLFGAGVDTDTRFALSSNHRPALCISAENNDSEMVELILKLGASANQADSRGNTALHVSCEMGFSDVTETLLEHRANVHALNQDGQTPLHLASRHGNCDNVEVLIRYGSDINKVDSVERTPLYFAASVHPSVIQCLLSSGAQSNIPDSYANYPLHVAVDSFGTSVEGISAIANSFPLAVFLLNRQKKSPLHIICEADRKDDKEILKELLVASIGILKSPSIMLNIETSQGHTPLHIAVLEKKVELVKLLLAFGASPESRDKLGRTPLDCAIRDGDIRMVYLLLCAGALVYRKKFDIENVRNNELSLILRMFVSSPMNLSSLCRIGILRNWGPTLQMNLMKLPKLWRNFLSFQTLSM